MNSKAQDMNWVLVVVTFTVLGSVVAKKTVYLPSGPYRRGCLRKDLLTIGRDAIPSRSKSTAEEAKVTLPAWFSWILNLADFKGEVLL